MGCKNSRSSTPVPEPEIPKPKKSHTPAPKPKIPKPKKSPASAKQKNISKENNETYQSVYTPNYYMNYSCTTPIPIPET